MLRHRSAEKNMAFLQLFFVLGAFTLFVNATSEILNKPDCDEFSKGVVFNETEAVGIWHLLHYRTERKSGAGESQCIEYSLVTDQERNELIERIGKYVNGLKWEAVTMKMQVPCSTVQTNRTRLYFLEKIQSDGTFRTMETPLLTAKEMPKEYHLYPMRMKIIEKDYMGMMDCNEKFVFVMGRQPSTDRPLDERIAKIMQQYWPEAHH